MKQRFFDFPLAFIGLESPLPEIIYPENPFGLRFVLCPKKGDRKNAGRQEIYNHFGSSFVYEVLRRPCYLDVKSPGDVENWDEYKSRKKEARRLFSEYLKGLVVQFGNVKVCAAEYDLQEVNWRAGETVCWSQIKVDELFKGRFKDYPWGDYVQDKDDLDLLFTSA